MAKLRALLALLACAAIVTACGSHSASPIEDAALQADNFVAADILAGDIDKAWSARRSSSPTAEPARLRCSRINSRLTTGPCVP
ncbi:hypothetical protein GCM10009631_04610 [Corynebacterium glaucum]